MNKVFILIIIFIASSCTNENRKITTKAVSQDSQFEGNSWKFECHRDEIAPKHWIDNNTIYNGHSTYAISGSGKKNAIGRWTTNVLVKPQTYYEFETHYLAQDIDNELKSILARVIWLDESGKRVIEAEYPKTIVDKNCDQWQTIKQVYQCPENAISAQLELVYRWDTDGSVYFSPATFKQTQAPSKRTVKLGTVYYQRKEMITPEENLNRFAKLTEKAGKLGADIVCLPEGITIVKTDKHCIDVAEEVPGPTTSFLGKIAKKYQMYIVAGIYERVGHDIYNTAILIGRDGKLVGKYHKVCLPNEEVDEGVTPGEDFPVFETDFGKIGMMICWDATFPEVARKLAMNGAEIIMLPIWDGFQELITARAIENQVYIVTSSYDLNSAIYDLEGKIIDETNEKDSVKVVEVDLTERKLWKYVGHLKNRIFREMPSN